MRNFLWKQVPFTAHPEEIATMTSSPRHAVAGRLHEFKGEAQEIAGKATGNPRPAAEGVAEKVCGKVMKVTDVEKFLGK